MSKKRSRTLICWRENQVDMIMSDMFSLQDLRSWMGRYTSVEVIGTSPVGRAYLWSLKRA